LGIPSDLYDAALARHHLVETSAVLKFDGNYLIAKSCFCALFQVIEARFGDGI
jgi:hypothetical protein